MKTRNRLRIGLLELKVKEQQEQIEWLREQNDKLNKLLDVYMEIVDNAKE